MCIDHVLRPPGWSQRDNAVDLQCGHRGESAHKDGLKRSRAPSRGFPRIAPATTRTPSSSDTSVEAAIPHGRRCIEACARTRAGHARGGARARRRHHADCWRAGQTYTSDRRVMEPYRVYFGEKWRNVPNARRRGFASRRANHEHPIVTGEHEYTRYGFRKLLEKG